MITNEQKILKYPIVCRLNVCLLKIDQIPHLDAIVSQITHIDKNYTI